MGAGTVIVLYVMVSTLGLVVIGLTWMMIKWFEEVTSEPGIYRVLLIGGFWGIIVAPCSYVIVSVLGFWLFCT